MCEGGVVVKSVEKGAAAIVEFELGAQGTANAQVSVQRKTRSTFNGSIIHLRLVKVNEV